MRDLLGSTKRSLPDGDERTSPAAVDHRAWGPIWVSWGRASAAQHANGESGVGCGAPARQEQDEGDEQESDRGSDAGLTQGVDGVDGEEAEVGDAVLLVWVRGRPVP